MQTDFRNSFSDRFTKKLLMYYCRDFYLAWTTLLHTHTHNRFTALWILSWTTQVSWYQKKHSPTHTHHGHQWSLSAFSIYYDPWHPPYPIHVLYSLSAQSLSKFSLVYLLACYTTLWNLKTQNNHCINTCTRKKCIYFTLNLAKLNQKNITGMIYLISMICSVPSLILMNQNVTKIGNVMSYLLASNR